MKKTLTILGFLAVFPAGVARADDDCFVPMADWQPRDAVAQLAEKNRWTVRRIKIDDGCYEINGQDAEGRRIEARIHPATLQVIKLKYDHHDDRYDNHDDDRSRRDREAGDND
ncbi:PepSY domain-containing protein [Aurantimonas sp. VKM B-3413]|uniref:PepSY domain-containing protein n=1 Tax=Aurantimonas sp. VKM B-3413 TaxID=2779401 RepID=UPI001E56B227|nr:PepSY domain-containing protein [Aurantimonas sp. VKM B-3413]MCB8836299.1 PepSY domain-containing protein [Aurantimonas sp. VKM B-3413]